MRTGRQAIWIVLYLTAEVQAWNRHRSLHVATTTQHQGGDNHSDHHDATTIMPYEEAVAQRIVKPTKGAGLTRAFDQVWTDATKVSRSHLRTDCRKPRKKKGEKEKSEEKEEKSEEKEERSSERNEGGTYDRYYGPAPSPVVMPSPIADDPVSRPVFMPSPIADDPVSRPVFMPSPIADDPVSRPVFMPSPIADDPVSRPTVPTPDTTVTRTYTHSHCHIHWVDGVRHYHHCHPHTHTYVVNSGGPHHHHDNTGEDPMDRDECGGDDYDPVNPAAPTPMPVDDPVSRPVFMPSPIADDPISRPVFMPSPIADDPISRPVFMPSPIADDPITRPTSNVVESPTSNEVENPTSNVVGPTTFAPPTAPSGGGNTAPSGGEDAAPTNSSPVGVPDPAPNGVATLDSICARYRDGTAPTTGNREEHSIFVTLNVDSTVDEQLVLEDLSRAMRENVGLSVLGCSSRRQLKEPSSRQLQDVTQMTNIAFSPPIRNADATCTQAIADTKCLPVKVDATVFYTGSAPPMAGGKLRQALFLLPAGSITGFQGWGEIAVLPPGETPRSTTTTDDGGINPASEENKGVEPGKNANSIAFVAAAAGSLVVILAALFFIRKRRKQPEKNDEIRELTDDEYDLGIETNDESYDEGYREERAVPKQAYVLNDEFSTIGSTNGHEVYRNVRHGPYETCSSPSCQMCEAKRQEGTRFIAAHSFEDKRHRSTSSSSSRRYTARDTVQF